MRRAPDITRAVEVLRDGGLVAFPTETVYGLGADASNERAIARVFAAKGRPRAHPLIVHLSPFARLDDWAVDVPDAARRLVRECWPGPLTIIVKKSARVSDAATGGGPTVGLRVPAHPIARVLLNTFGGGIAAPSANRFGKVSPTTADHVVADLGDAVDYVLDGGACNVGVESTIVDFSRARPALLRPGGLPRETIEEILGAPLADAGDDAPAAPGTLASHYAPRAELIACEPDEVAREFARAAGKKVAILRFDDAATAAHDLYAELRDLDAQGVEIVIAALPPAGGLGEAVRDRLRRAAGPRTS